MKKSTLRPGLLVSLKTSIHGNVAYKVNEIEEDHLDDDGVRRATWQTERTIRDPAEHEEAIKVRTRCRSLITGVCSTSSFGLLCPEAWEGRLADAVEEAQEMVAAFNRRAALTRISVYVLVGRIAESDSEAVRASNSDIRELLDTMESGLTRMDVKMVREAATRARSLGAMLSEDASEQVAEAITMARRAARVIVRAGAEGETEINKEALDVLARARVSFLDLDGGRELVVPTTPGRGIDLPLAAVDEFGNRFDDDDLPDFSRPAVRTVDFGE
jgi:hypothetical protein